MTSYSVTSIFERESETKPKNPLRQHFMTFLVSARISIAVFGNVIVPAFRFAVRLLIYGANCSFSFVLKTIQIVCVQLYYNNSQQRVAKRVLFSPPNLMKVITSYSLHSFSCFPLSKSPISKWCIIILPLFPFAD